MTCSVQFTVHYLDTACYLHILPVV